MKSIRDLELNGKRVLLRADLNVPTKDGIVQDFTRIDRLIPTIELLKSKCAKIILISHFGRPDGKVVASLSLKFLAPILQDRLKTKVFFGESKDLEKSAILLLENLRFHPEEEANDDEFAKNLAKLADFYINDAFSCSHRAHASIVAITKYLPSYPGLLLQEEVSSLEKSLDLKLKPNVAIVGGKKVSTKFPILHNLSKKVDYLVIGGAMANTFAKAMGHDIGGSYYEPELIDNVKSFIKQCSCKLIIPSDFIVATKKGDSFINPEAKSINDISDANVILDIGPKSVTEITTILEKSKSVMWNGPLGMFEDARFAVGTNEVAKVISELDIISVAGGGDIVSALEQAGFAKNFTYISTAGGAFLEWLEGKELPGITVLKN